MKQFLVIGILLAAFSANTHAQKKKSIVMSNVKSVVVYEQKLDKSNEKAIKDSEAFFDNQGNTIEEIEYENGKVKKHTKYEYDDDGNKVKEIELSSTGKPISTLVYEYNTDDQKIKETELNPSGIPIKITEYKYDGDLKVEKAVYDGSKKLKSKKTYQYQTY